MRKGPTRQEHREDLKNNFRYVKIFGEWAVSGLLLYLEALARSMPLTEPRAPFLGASQGSSPHWLDVLQLDREAGSHGCLSLMP